MIPANNEIMRGVFKITNTLKREDIKYDIVEITKMIERLNIHNIEWSLGDRIKLGLGHDLKYKEKLRRRYRI